MLGHGQGTALGSNCNAFGIVWRVVEIIRNLIEKDDRGMVLHNVDGVVIASNVGNDNMTSVMTIAPDTIAPP